MNKTIKENLNTSERKEIGKVYLTVIGKGNICECGKKVKINDFILWPLDKTVEEIDSEEKIRVGFCECGNIFMRKYLHLDYIKWAKKLWHG